MGRTRRILERIAPSILDCTILISPRVRATVLTIISTAFPKVAFRRAPTTSPASLDNSSVALLRSIASGRMASMLMENTNVGFHSKWPPRILNGTKPSSRRILLEVMNW